MNKISKLISVLLVMLLLVFTFYGSGREMKTQTETQAGASWLNRSNNLTIWYTDERLSAYISKAAVEFGEREDVTVIPVLKPADSFIEGCYAASVEGESYPDVIITGSETLEKAYYSGMACEITDEDMQIGPLNFSDAAVNAVTYKGMKLGYPLSFDTCVLVYNRTYLEQWASQMAIADLTGNVIDMEGGSSETEDTGETGLTVDDIDPAELEALTSEYIQKMVPYTLEDLLTIANSYSVPDGVEGILSWDMSSIMYNYWLVGGAFTVGGECGDDRHDISINNSTAAECLKKYQNLHDYFSIESDEVTYDSVIQQFIDGKTVFTIGGYDLVSTLKEASDDGSFAYEYGFSEMPNVTSDIRSRSLAITSVVCINSYSAKKDLAERFALCLTREETDVFSDLTGMACCARTFGWDGGANQIYALEYADSVSLPKMMETENYWMQIEAMFARIWEGGDIDDELEMLEDSLNSVMNNSV